ncbi:hypothetical protein [Pararhizobium sp. IMCC21322]|uniref:hypothetical protein n=1 Tax=Pararhizobium sp. IMCC21322 TaxID=3067903 RepID=UPI0027428A8D|nr:hypothetical protein [Pararhizobium sp. IMCC21322]
MLKTILLTVALVAPFQVSAQDRSGNDTASDWLAKHYASFGLWDSVCDERMEAGELRQRCYLRYVDVFSPRPVFMASFVFAYTQDKQTQIELGFERGVRYSENGFRVERQGERVWSAVDGCLDTSPCALSGAAAQDMLDHMSGGDVLVQEFADRSGQTRLLEWDLSRFADAVSDYRREASARNLL